MSASPTINSEPPDVSILIVNYNGAHLLRGCLESVATIRSPRFEVVVVDNGSADSSVGLIEEFRWVKLVRSKQNLGFAGGNNLGLPHCSGKYVLLLNNDTIVREDFLEVLHSYMESHPEVGIAQGKMILPRYDGRLDVCGSFLTAFGLPYHYGYFKPDGPKYEKNYPVFSAKGACLMFRRNLISEVGGYLFDEDFFCYYEETDLCHRAWLAGWEVHFVPGPPVQHLMGSTGGGPHSTFALTHYLRNMVVSLSSNLSFQSRLRILPLFFFVLTVGLLAYIVTLRAGPAKAHALGLAAFFSRRGQIRRRRAQLKQFRRRSDRRIFEKVLVTPGPDYFLKTLKGRIAEYQDPEL